MEEQFVADSRTRKAILTKRKGKAIPSRRTTGSKVRAVMNRRVVVAATVEVGVKVAGDPFSAPELEIVTLFIPDVEM